MTQDQGISLGEFLRQERERRGITLEQVASATKISIKLLHALEGDHYAELPAKPFVRGFVTSYVRFIGLDPKEILTRFGDYIDSKSHDRPNREAGHSGYAFEKREGEQSRTVLWFIMGGFVVVGGLVMVVLKPSLKHHRSSHADRLKAVHSSPSPSVEPSPLLSVLALPSGSPVPQPSHPEATPSALAAAAAPPAPLPPPVTPSPSPSPSPSPTPSPTPTSKPSPKPSPSPAASATAEAKPDPLNSGIHLKSDEIKHKIIFKAVSDIWVRYQVDERPVMKFILRKDRVLVLRAQTQIKFQTSDAAGVTFNYNGRGTKPLSTVKNLTARQHTPTYIVPAEVAEKTQEAFPGEKPLPTEPPPPSPSAAAPTTESP